MTACGPYSEATLMYEPVGKQFIAAVASPGSVLDIVGKRYPETLKLIERAGLTRLYNSDISEYRITLFVSKSYLYGCGIPVARAYQLCKASTVPLRLNEDTMKSSRLFVLKTLSDGNDMTIKSCCNVTLANGSKVLEYVKCTNGNVIVVDTNMWRDLA